MQRPQLHRDAGGEMIVGLCEDDEEESKDGIM